MRDNKHGLANEDSGSKVTNKESSEVMASQGQIKYKSALRGTAYGGQAVIEGVMMRGRYKVAIAVRNPKGEIVVYEDTLSPALYRSSLTQLPFVRGAVTIWDALGLGTRALLWAGQVAMGIEKPEVSRSAGLGLAAVSMGLSTGMVFLSPAAGASGLGRLFGIKNHTLTTILEGMLRLGLIVGYIYAIGQTKEGTRLFQYHGAEHKTVNAVEAGAPLTPESVKTFPLEHPRCGTAFLLTVVMISTLVQIVIGRPRFSVLLLSRLILMPIIAGIAYEYIRFASQHMDDPLVRAIVAPNLLFQRLTTREPDLEQIEVAITAMEKVLAGEKSAASEAEHEIELPVRPISGNGHAH